MAEPSNICKPVPLSTKRERPHVEIVIRKPAPEDAAMIRQLALRAGSLDVNSTYQYLLLCRDFSDTCRLAEIAGIIVGFLTAYRPPMRPENLFIWQIAVDAAHRGQGIAQRMVVDVLDSGLQPPAEHIEATISPSNQASQRLFRALAKHCNCRIEFGEGFGTGLFLPEVHEQEDTWRLGLIGSKCLTGKAFNGGDKHDQYV